MIWVYGIREQADVAPPLEALSHRGLTAVFGRREHERSPEGMWEHERVVETLMPVLPMRFASTVEDEEALRRFLAERHDSLAAALANVAGRVEVGVRAVGRREESGREHLLRKLALHEPLAALAVDSRVRSSGSAYLVEQDALGGFTAAVERLQEEHPDVAILCTGPWPPYSFV
jgi:hypothetical protein